MGKADGNLFDELQDSGIPEDYLRRTLKRALYREIGGSEVITKTAPRDLHQPYPNVYKELKWCIVRFLCSVVDGKQATIDISANGGFPWPWDDEGTVEILQGPDKDHLEHVEELVGNESTSHAGPIKLWAHLKGGTEDNPDEPECDVRIYIE